MRQAIYNIFVFIQKRDHILIFISDNLGRLKGCTHQKRGCERELAGEQSWLTQDRMFPYWVHLGFLIFDFLKLWPNSHIYGTLSLTSELLNTE